MVPLRQRLRCLVILCGGAALGLSLATIGRAVGAAEPAKLTLLAILPFLLALLTGVAKTTTA